MRHDADGDRVNRVVKNVLDRVSTHSPEIVSLKTRLLFALGSPRVAMITAALLTVVLGTSLINSSRNGTPNIRWVAVAPGMTSPLLDMIVSGRTPTATEVIVNFGVNKQ